MQKRHVIGWVVVVVTVAVMGTAQALPGVNTVDSFDIINGEVHRPDIQNAAVNSRKVADFSLLGTDIKDGTLGGNHLADGSVSGADIADSTLTAADLGTNSVTSLELADSTVTGTDIASSTISGGDVATDSLTGSDILESSLNLGSQCTSGLVHSWARVKGAAGMPAAFTSSSTYRDTQHTCSGGQVYVRRAGVGEYYVRFTADPAQLAIATPHSGDGDNDNVIAVRKENATDFQVILRDNDGGLDDGWFTIVTV